MTPYQFEVWKRKTDNDKKYREVTEKAFGPWIRSERVYLIDAEDLVKKYGLSNIEKLRRYLYRKADRLRFEKNYGRVQIGTLELENVNVTAVYESSPPITPESDHFHGFTSSE